MVIIREKIRFIIVIAVILAVLFPCINAGASAKDDYFEAEACYKSLRQNPKKLKYRSNWLRCIDKFQKVYRQDPDGPWAAAGLYRSANIYQELHGYSGKASDTREAVDIYQRIIKRFPNSKYRDKAAQAMRQLPRQYKTGRQTSRKKTTPPKAASTAKTKYLKAEDCYNNLRESAKKMKYRDNWMRCIKGFHDAYWQDPEGPWAAVSLYMKGKLSQELYRISKSKSDLRSTHEIFEQVIAQFPDSRYQVKAALIVDSLPRIKKDKSGGNEDDVAREIATSRQTSKSQNTVAVDGMVTVKSLRFWSNPNYTRIVIDADAETSFYHHLLKEDPALKKPPRLYVELTQSRLGKDIQKLIPINDDLLIDARAGQYTNDLVRVVVDLKSFMTYKIFSLKDPFRIVIDVWGADAKISPPKPKSRVTAKKGTKLPPSALAKQLSLGVRRIVIDPGHGGKDYGAPGYLKGVHEKKVVLQVARRLAKKLEKELNCEVIMTRNNDRFLTLEERTAFANTKNADLFISLHTNASRDRRAYGIETYFLNLATDDEAIRVAAMENATSTKNISDLQTILSDLMQNAKINESSRLAGYVQTSIYGHLRKKGYTRIKSKGVKQAPFYVLLGAQMPAILIETSFISNSRECKRLVDSKYQERLCEGIVMGVKKYIKEINPTVFHRTNPLSGPSG